MTNTETGRRPTAVVPDVVRQLCALVAQLGEVFPERSFTLDGHLVGSIGEVLAAEKYGLQLLSMTSEKHDAETTDGRLVQIKTTQGTSVGLRSEPDYLLVLKLCPNGSIDEVYNGPGALAWGAAGKPQRNGQSAIRVTKLRTLMGNVSKADQIPRLTH